LLNVVTHTGYTATQRVTALAADPSVGCTYVESNINRRDALYLIEVTNFEGEFRIGLGRCSN